MAKANEPKTVTFPLRAAESNLINYVIEHQQAIFSGVLSTIAMDRLSYPVTERTQFKLNDERTDITLTELPVEQPKKEEIEEAVKTAK